MTMLSNFMWAKILKIFYLCWIRWSWVQFIKERRQLLNFNLISDFCGNDTNASVVRLSINCKTIDIRFRFRPLWWHIKYYGCAMSFYYILSLSFISHIQPRWIFARVYWTSSIKWEKIKYQLVKRCLFKRV